MGKNGEKTGIIKQAETCKVHIFLTTKVKVAKSMRDSDKIKWKAFSELHCTCASLIFVSALESSSYLSGYRRKKKKYEVNNNFKQN